MTNLTESVDSAATPTIAETNKGRLFSPFVRRLPWWGEAAVAVVFYLLYDAVQSLTQGDEPAATAHALDLVQAERWLHIFVEPDVNRWATHHRWLAIVAGYDYGIAHVLITVTVLAYLWWRRPGIEVALRNAVVGMSLVALIVYWLYPVSPPRFVVVGVSDTLVHNDILGARHSYKGLVNLYAAMPSLHVAWAIWSAAAIVFALGARWRHLAWLYPCWTTFVVVSTANHYLLDAAAGAVLAAIAIVPMRSSLRRGLDSPAGPHRPRFREGGFRQGRVEEHYSSDSEERRTSGW